MSEMLTLEKCVNCGKEIYIPWILPYEGNRKPTGMPLYDEHYGPYPESICIECAFKLHDEGTIGLVHETDGWEACLLQGSKVKEKPE